MRPIITLSVFILLLSCSGGGGGENTPQISAGDIVANESARAFIKESSSKLPANLQIKDTDLESWKQDQLITEQEALEISENL